MKEKPFITIQSDIDTAMQCKAPVQVVRLSNGKLAVHIRHNGELEPFLFRGIEIGFYDLRINTTDKKQWDIAFSHIRQANANTVEFMIHLLDIEPEQGQFIWTVPDYVISLCEKYGLKVRFVFFTSLFTGQHLSGHIGYGQQSRESTLVDVPDPSNPWLYGDENNIQWSFNRYNGKIQAKTYADYYNMYQVIYLCYANPFVLEQVAEAFREMCLRYRESEIVVGYQVTNEEGMQWRVPNGDANPHTVKALHNYLTEKYKGIEKLNKDWGTGYHTIEEVHPQNAPYEKWGDFRRDLVASYIRSLMQAGHQADPYKPFFMNIFAGEELFSNYGLYNNTATDASTYRTCCTDGVAAMLYKPGYRDRTILNRICDEININAPADVLLATTELGIGERYWDMENQFGYNVYQYLQRGGQGYAAYDWGEFVTPAESWEGSPNEVMVKYRNIADLVERHQAALIKGVPVDTVLPERSIFRLSTESPWFEVTTMKENYDDADMLGLCYNFSEDTRQLTIDWMAAEKGEYELVFDRPGLPVKRFKYQVNKVDPDMSFKSDKGKISIPLGEVEGKSFAVLTVSRNV